MSSSLWPWSNPTSSSSSSSTITGDSLKVARQDYLSLGNLKVSPLGVGTWAWGNKLLWSYSKEDDEELQRTFDYVVSKGINWMDTADSYGTGK